MKPALALLTASLALAAHGLLLADTSGRSLTDVRKQINSGTWPGITLIEAGPKTQPPAASAPAPAAPAVPAAGAAPVPATAATNTTVPVTPAAEASATPAAGALPAAAPAAAIPAPAATPVTPVAPVASPSSSSAIPAAGVSAPAAPVATVPATVPAAVSPAPASSALSFGERLRGWLGEPLSGQSMQEAKRLDSPSIGISLPTAAAGAASAPATPTR